MREWVVPNTFYPTGAVNLLSAQMKELASELGFIKVYTSPYRPQGNSVLE